LVLVEVASISPPRGACWFVGDRRGQTIEHGVLAFGSAVDDRASHPGQRESDPRGDRVVDQTYRDALTTVRKKFEAKYPNVKADGDITF
jgi:hypothetical protein